MAENDGGSHNADREPEEKAEPDRLYLGLRLADVEDDRAWIAYQRWRNQRGT